MNSQIENFHKSAKLLPNKSLVLQNADPIIHSLNNTNESLPNLLQHISFRHYILKSKLSSIVGFAFQVGKKSIRLFNNCTTQGGGGGGGRKQMGGLPTVKYHLKQLLLIL